MLRVRLIWLRACLHPPSGQTSVFCCRGNGPRYYGNTISSSSSLQLLLIRGSEGFIEREERKEVG